MSLKPSRSQILNESRSSKTDKWSGQWGRINPQPQSVTVLRLCRTTGSREETTSYPYRVFLSWNWRQVGDHEEISIDVGSDLITIHGRALARVVEALDQGALEILCEVSNVLAEESTIGISSITITKAEKF